jgi:hypothetical protein
MGSNYLANVTDGYGLPTSLPTGLAQQASSIIDAYLKRPEGLVYTVDQSGAPCSMVAASPTQTYTLQGSITAGSNVVVTISPALVKPDLVGEVLVLDNSSSSLCEACVVSSTSGNNQITLSSVKYAHTSGALAQAGLVIKEDRNCPSKRSIIRVSRGPIANVVSLLGRYAYGRRSDQVGGLYQEMNLLAAVQTFGGPPQWIPIPTTQCSWSDQTQEVWVPAGMLMAYYSDVRVSYVAGYTAANLPDPIIRATVSIATALNGNGGLSTQMKYFAAGDTKAMRFSASLMDDDMYKMLDPFKAKTMF